MLKYTTIINAFIEEFHRIAISFPNMDDGKLTYLFMDGLQEAIWSLLKVTKPPMVAVSIHKAKLLERFNHPRRMITKNTMESVTRMSIGKEAMRGRPTLQAQNPWTNRTTQPMRNWGSKNFASLVATHEEKAIDAKKSIKYVSRGLWGKIRLWWWVEHFSTWNWGWRY